MMKNSLHGFCLQSSRPLPELNATLHQMEHLQSGAQLVWLERPEPNKTFGIAFRTPPTDDTGVFHILEHSVLCGSRRYPVREPFVELMKSSLNTYLNAMTFPDRTVFPVSSRNQQDLIHLMRVYLDAVFHPLLHTRPEIFEQEGWHYELDQNGDLCYKGVVFHEMKGAFASPDQLLERQINRLLFPQTCYRYVSGGDPAHIPDLTYQQFAQTHTRLYHPSNAYLFLDGDLDIDRMLAILDGEYLREFQRMPAPPLPAFQPPVNGGQAVIPYDLSPGEELAGRERWAAAYVAGSFRDREALVALRVLADLLCGGNQAPLKRRVLSEGLARDVQMQLRDGLLQPWVMLQARDIAPGQTGQVQRVLQDELERLAGQGLDHRRIMATLDNLEFQMRQRCHTPQGLTLGLLMLESWIYGGDPAANLPVGTLFETLRRQCDQGYFEALLRRVLLDNPHTCQVILQPSHTAGQQRQTRERQRLNAVRQRWSEADLEQLRLRQAKREAWQNTPDSAEALACIPRLSLDQVDPQPEVLPLESGVAAGLPVLRHLLPNGGITDLNLYFALDDLDAEQLSQASLLCTLLGSLDTAGHGLADLQIAQRSLLGTLQFSLEAYGRAGDPRHCRTFLCVSASMLDDKVRPAAELLTEMMRQTRLDQPQAVGALVSQQRAALAQSLVMAGHRFAMGRVAACCTAEGAVQELTGGISYYLWLKALEAEFASRSPALLPQLADLADRIFCRSRLTVSITASDRRTEPVIADLLARRLPEGSGTGQCAGRIAPLPCRREGMVLPVDVCFAALGGRFAHAGSGTAAVLARILSLNYLWNAVRVQGGAYGAGMVTDPAGMLACYSYRDPTPARTLDCFRRAAEQLTGVEGMDLNSWILGTIGESDPLLTPHTRGKTADARHWSGITPQALGQMRREMMTADATALKALEQPLAAALNGGAVCILGSRQQLDRCGLDCIAVL